MLESGCRLPSAPALNSDMNKNISRFPLVLTVAVALGAIFITAAVVLAILWLVPMYRPPSVALWADAVAGSVVA